MFHLLTSLCIIVHLTAHFVWSDEAIYVSRSHGNDSTTCGKQFSPCRTISYAIHQVSEGSYIYLDGTGTSKNPYTCEPLYPGDQGIHLTKSVSFERIQSRAYISCLHGNQWLVNGIQHKDGLRVSFYGFAFQNTSLRFLDASVHIMDCWFKDSEHVTMNFSVSKSARFELALNNSVFQQNAACMAVESNTKMKIYIRITNSTFIQNGNANSSVPSILCLWSSEKDDINIQISNCSFQNNTFGKNGMILVENEQGTTNISLHQFKFEDNGGDSNTISGFPDGVFFLLSAQKDAKFDPAAEKEAIEFIESKTGDKIDDFHKSLKDGQVLCHLANALKPGSVKKINESKMAFKMMENIGNFLDVCQQLGLNKIDLFQTVELYENQNIPLVINSILALKRKVTGGESTPNPRDFSEEQLKAGQNVIGLQMGSNKGASQKGMTAPGATRQIRLEDNMDTSDQS